MITSFKFVVTCNNITVATFRTLPDAADFLTYKYGHYVKTGFTPVNEGKDQFIVGYTAGYSVWKLIRE